eukprot:3508066-Prymnesium_polylepis.1
MPPGLTRAVSLRKLWTQALEVLGGASPEGTRRGDASLNKPGAEAMARRIMAAEAAEAAAELVTADDPLQEESSGFESMRLGASLGQEDDGEEESFC